VGEFLVDKFPSLFEVETNERDEKEVKQLK